MPFLDRFKKRKVEKGSTESEKESSKKQAPSIPSRAPSVSVQGMEHTLHIGLLPHQSEKAIGAQRQGVYTFRVFRGVSKARLAQAIERSFNVRVVKVRIVNLPSKMRRRGRSVGRRPSIRKAIVTLEKGHEIDLGV